MQDEFDCNDRNNCDKRDDCNELDDHEATIITQTKFIMARQNRRQQGVKSDSESDEEGHGNQDHPAVDDREEEDDDEGVPATMLSTI